MSCDNFQTWIKEVMERIIETLGPNVDEVQYDLVNSCQNIMSMQYSVCVKFKDKTKRQEEKLHLILKKPDKVKDEYRQIYDTDNQCHNEILFYKMYARPEDNFARCFYADERPPFESVIALEDVSIQGYSPAPFLYNAPLEYTLTVMREMGRFHGKGYVMKELEREKFFDIVRRIEATRYGETKISFKQIININAPRAVEYLRSRGHDPVFCDKMETLFSNAYDEVMMKAVEPLEPLSTLCHGDPSLSNVLFKRKADGQYRAMLIDFGFIRYSTPVVDLSSYVYIYCFNEESKSKFFDIMRAYHDALKEYLLDAGIWDSEKYSYDAILDNYRKGSIFGFILASCYITTLLGYTPADLSKDINMSWVEFSTQVKHDGGDEVSKILADMLLHLRDLDCLKHIL